MIDVSLASFAEFSKLRSDSNEMRVGSHQGTTKIQNYTCRALVDFNVVKINWAIPRIGA